MQAPQKGWVRYSLRYRHVRSRTCGLVLSERHKANKAARSCLRATWIISDWAQLSQQTNLTETEAEAKWVRPINISKKNLRYSEREWKIVRETLARKESRAKQYGAKRSRGEIRPPCVNTQNKTRHLFIIVTSLEEAYFSWWDPYWWEETRLIFMWPVPSRGGRREHNACPAVQWEHRDSYWRFAVGGIVLLPRMA